MIEADFSYFKINKKVANQYKKESDNFRLESDNFHIADFQFYVFNNTREPYYNTSSV